MKKGIRIFINIIHVLLMISSLVFTIVASLKDKAHNSNDFEVYLILYGLVFIPPMFFNLVVFFFKPKEERRSIGFSEILQIIMSINVLLILNRFGYFPNDKVLYGPWILILVADLCYMAYCKLCKT